METMEDLVAEQPFFNGLEPEFIALFAGCASNKVLREHEYVLKEGTECDQFFIIKQGKIAIEIYAGDKGSIKIQTLGPGELIGWSWLIPPFTSEFDARALATTHVIVFNGQCLRKKCEQDYKFGYEMLNRITRVIIKRLQATRVQLIDIYK